MFERMVRVLFVLLALSIGISYVQDATYSGSRLTVSLIATGLLGFAAMATFVPWRIRCWLVALTFAFGANGLLYSTGFLGPNVMVAVAIALVITVSCLGIGQAAIVFSLFLLGYLWVAHAHVTGATRVDPAPFDLSSVGNWVRVGAVFMLLAIGAIAFVGTMLTRLAKSQQQSHELLARAAIEAQRHLAATEHRSKLEADLQQAQKFEALGRLAGGVAHDLNNFLVVIVNNASWIRSISDGDAKEAAQEIEQASERAARLARNLLVFGSQQASLLAPLDFDSAIEQSLKVVHPMMPKGTTVEFEPGGIGKVNSSAADLDQVVLNLCLNARDAMPAGGTIRVSTSQRQHRHAGEDKHFAVLRVTDQGHGIPEPVRQRIFEPFFTTKDRDKGTGLGLAVVHGIAKQHKGLVLVDSKVGKGATFEVLFPAPQTNASTAAAKRPPRTADVTVTTSPTMVSTKPSTILVLEDDDQVRQIIVNVLRNDGYQVFDFARGPDLLQWCREAGAKADLLVTDVNLSEQSGIETYQHARLLLPRLSCLVCSGSYANPVDPSFWAESHHGRLDKPFRSDDLRRSVRALLRGETSAS